MVLIPSQESWKINIRNILSTNYSWHRWSDKWDKRGTITLSPPWQPNSANPVAPRGSDQKPPPPAHMRFQNSIEPWPSVAAILIPCRSGSVPWAIHHTPWFATCTMKNPSSQLKKFGWIIKIFFKKYSFFEGGINLWCQKNISVWGNFVPWSTKVSAPKVSDGALMETQTDGIKTLNLKRGVEKKNPEQSLYIKTMKTRSQFPKPGPLINPFSNKRPSLRSPNAYPNQRSLATKLLLCNAMQTTSARMKATPRMPQKLFQLWAEVAF